MTTQTAKSAAKPRKATKGERREQLIRATLECIAKRGIIGTTLSAVATKAGLSQGIVNLHFKSKENLLNETLAFLSDDYMTTLQKNMAAADDHPAARLRAYVETDFSKSIFTRKKIAVWFAFQGEAKSRPTYRRICNQRDDELDGIMLDVVKAVSKRGNYQDVDAQVVVDALAALSCGLWMSYLIKSENWDAARARNVAFSYLHCVFPREF